MWSVFRELHSARCGFCGFVLRPAETEFVLRNGFLDDVFEVFLMFDVFLIFVFVFVNIYKRTAICCWLRPTLPTVLAISRWCTSAKV